ncbi:MAG: hypothetical protein NVS3B26_29290 [Mycobacteriales bacterium]
MRQRSFLRFEVTLLILLAVVMVLPGDVPRYQVLAPDTGPPVTCQTIPQGKLPCGQHLESNRDHCPRFSLATNTTCTASVRKHWVPIPAIALVMVSLAWARRRRASAPEDRRVRSAAVALLVGIVVAAGVSAVTYVYVTGYINSHDE